MRIVGLVIVLAASTLSAQTTTAVSRLDLSLEQRLDLPQRVASASLRLTDFVSFIATFFKVPLLVETPAQVPNLQHPRGLTPHGNSLTRQWINFAGFSGRTKRVWRISTRSVWSTLRAISSTFASRSFYFP
jgi:hypothetical protein